jgi:hypothetical protein
MYTDTELTDYLNGIRDIATRPEKTHHRYEEATFTPLFSRLIDYSEFNMESVYQQKKHKNRP